MKAQLPDREAWANQLWQWLPGVYRARDDSGQLAAFLRLFGDELWRQRQLIAQQHDDLFVDSAQPWVLAYLADLVGSELLVTGDPAQLRSLAARNREDILNTLHRRRRKGTLAAFGDAAADAGGFGVQVVEMLQRCARIQHWRYLKPEAVMMPDLRDGSAMALLRTPFTRAAALVDLRASTPHAGSPRPNQLLAWTWPIASQPVVSAPPAALGDGRWRFDALARDGALYAGAVSAELRRSVALRVGAAGADILRDGAQDLPIRLRDLHDHGPAYLDSALGFAIHEDGIALVGGPPAALPSLLPATGFGELAQRRGLVAPDADVYAASTRLSIEVVRLGAVFNLVLGVPTPLPYSPGVAFASQLQLRNPAGALALDMSVPSIDYTAGVAPYQPNSGEFHHPSLLLRLANTGVGALALAPSELILRNGRGAALQAYLPALAALAAGDAQFFYIADDGSSYHARGDHGPGLPDRNPDGSLFGSYSALHLARASEGQRRIRPGHPAGALRWRRLVARSLCCWDQPLQPPLAPGEVAVDPERGRFAMPAAEAPAGDLTVSYRFGRTAAIGAGAFAPGERPQSTLTVAQQCNAGFSRIQDAIDAAPDGGAAPVVIEILDSARYEEALAVDGRSFPGGLWLRAAPLRRPLLVKPAAALRLLLLQNSSLGQLVLQGLWLAQGPLRLDGAAGALGPVTLDHCTLDPASATLQIAAPGASAELRACISGPVSVSGAGRQLRLVDSAVLHPAASVEAPGGVAALVAAAALAVERSTLIGDVTAPQAAISNSLLLGGLTLTDMAASCLRFSRLPPALAAAGFRCTGAMPMLLSLDSADPGWLHLHPHSATVLMAGAEEGGEMGVFHTAALPWRRASVQRRLAESVPAGLVPLQAPVLPGLRYPGRPLR